MQNITPESIDTLLPQTQCGLCGYGGCLPYATAMAKGEASINLCPPGGVDTLNALGKHLNQDASPYLDEMKTKALPPRLAIIREAECIGCTKCIQACPVDAIVGSAKLMHTIIQDACTGCELCIPPCPVDCIDLIDGPPTTEADKTLRRERFQTRNHRLLTESAEADLKQNTKEDKKQQLKNMLAKISKKNTLS